MKINFIDLFYIFKETDNSETPNLTEERIYSFCQDIANNFDKVPVFSGATQNKGVVGFIPNYIKTVKSKIQVNANKVNYYLNKNDCITLVADGMAGQMFYRTKEEFPIFSMNISCIALFKKENEDIKKIYLSFDGLNLKWFFFRFGNYFKNIVQGEGVQHFTQQIYSTIELDIPKLKEQEKELEDYLKIYNLNHSISDILYKIESLFKKNFSLDEEKDYYEKSTSEVFDITSGNSGLTEEYLYEKIMEPNRNINFLVGSVKIEPIKIPLIKHPKKDTEKINFIEKKEGLLVIRKGKAGLIKYLPIGNYATNDDAYLLSINKEFHEKVILKWISYAYKGLFLEFSSSSDNGTWNKTAFIKQGLIFIIPIFKQERMLEYYRRLEDIKEKALSLERKIDSLMEKD